MDTMGKKIQITDYIFHLLSTFTDYQLLFLYYIAYWRFPFRLYDREVTLLGEEMQAELVSLYPSFSPPLTVHSCVLVVITHMSSLAYNVTVNTYSDWSA